MKSPIVKRHSLHIQPNLFQKKPQTLPLKQSWHTLDLANQYSPVFVFQKTYKFINSVPLDSLKEETKKKKIKLSVSVLQYKSTIVFMLYQIYLQHPGQSKQNNKISVQTQTRKNTSELVTITIRLKFH